MRLKQKQPERGDDGCACQIEEPLERIDSKQVRDGQFFLARQEKWAHRFASAAEKENGREASESHSVNRPEVRGPQVYAMTLAGFAAIFLLGRAGEQIGRAHV